MSDGTSSDDQLDGNLKRRIVVKSGDRAFSASSGKAVHLCFLNTPFASRKTKNPSGYDGVNGGPMVPEAKKIARKAYTSRTGRPLVKRMGSWSNARMASSGA